MNFRRKRAPEEVSVRLDRAEKIARDHARRLLRLETEAGIYRPNPMNKERPV